MTRILLAMAVSFVCAAQTLEQPSRSVTDPGIVTTRQAITPAGVPSVFQGRVFGVAWAGDSGELWVLHATEVYRLDWKNNRVVTRTPHAGTPGNQAIFTDPATGDAVVGQSTREGQGGVMAGLSVAHAGSLRPLARGLGRFQPGALSVSAEADSHGHRYVAVPLVWENKLALVDAASGEVMRQIETGIAPFAAVIDRKGSTAWVSNLGGRPPKPDELFASPMQKPSEKVVVDSRGVASTGAVTRMDLETGKATHTLAVGLHPTALALDEARRRLYVANGNGDSVSVIDTERVQVVKTIAIQPFSQAVRGIAPTALQVSADGATLYAACGGINAVAVIDTGTGKIRGMIPTGWYPNGLALDPGGKYLAVSSLLGPGSGWRDAPSKRFVHANRGSVAVLQLPNAAQLASYTTAVAENNRLRLAGTAPDNAREAARNARPGGDSGALRRAFDDRARGLHHQGESHVRPGAGRYGEGQRRSVAGDVRRRRHAQPAPPGRAVRPARQLLRHRRKQRRRASVDHAGERDRVLSVARLPGPQLSVRRQRSDGVFLRRIPVELCAGARALGARVRRVCGAHEHRPRARDWICCANGRRAATSRRIGRFARRSRR